MLQLASFTSPLFKKLVLTTKPALVTRLIIAGVSICRVLADAGTQFAIFFDIY
jgi:hypothetical protein